MKVRFVLLIIFAFILINCNNEKFCGSNSPRDYDPFVNGYYFTIINSNENLLLDRTTYTPYHPDSLILFSEELNEVGLYKGHNYAVGDFFYPLKLSDGEDVYYALDQKTFYLRLNYQDLDTLKITFENCRVKEIYYNEKIAKKRDQVSIFPDVEFYFEK